LQPIQALALFYDFKYLTPIGSDGDVMVRRLARRLVDVDLLDQAAELLKYQVDNRLEGLARSIVSTDLALVQLMNRQPEKALQAINDSRSTLLPAALAAERRVIEARAWNELGKPDHALEILATDKSAEATELRNDIAWRKKVWTQAGPAFEKELGDRWKAVDNPLSEEDETRLLRSAVSYSLANDSKALARLKQRFSPLVEKARQADALKIALDGMDDEAVVAPSQVLSTLAQSDKFAGWAARAKQKFQGQALAATTQPVTPAPAKAAKAAATPKPQA
jgi:predicted negative regulator of RcsB-dependent stress response